MKRSMWWHRHRGHAIDHCRVSVPLWDPSATGDLWRCSCGKVWAK